LADMLRAMHLIVNAVDEAFEPESGAYAAGGHDHDHAHTAAPVAPVAKAKLASIPIAAAPAAPHVHGPGCGHQH
jgi:urease accessory protein